MSPNQNNKLKEIKKRRFTRAFRKDDARHYVIYAELCKMKIDSPYQRAEVILEALKSAKIL